MKILLAVFMMTTFTFAEEYKVPFEWNLKDAPKAKFKKYKITNQEDRDLASEEAKNVRYWNYKPEDKKEENVEDSE